MPIIPVFRRLKQEDQKFKASLDYTERPYLKKKRIHTFLNQNSQ
jgi:hypothetical protein